SRRCGAARYACNPLACRSFPIGITGPSHDSEGVVVGASDVDLKAEPGQFVSRHIGPREREIADMLAQVGCESLEALVNAVVPADIPRGAPLVLPAARSEHEVLDDMRDIAKRNQLRHSMI